MSEKPTEADLSRDLIADLEIIQDPFPGAWIANAPDGWPAAIRRALVAETNLHAIIRVCALAGIGSHGQSVLCRVKDLHTTLGEQIKRADAAENRIVVLEDETSRLRSLVRDTEPVRNERDHYERDLTEIGCLLGCNHLDDGLARCVSDLVDERDKLAAFKTFCHSYLDSHDVPHHPPGIHGTEGCRIGDRLDWVFAQLQSAHERNEELLHTLQVERLFRRAEGGGQWNYTPTVWRRKSAHVRAVQWFPGTSIEGVTNATVMTLRGPMPLEPGDWVAEGPDGNRWVVEGSVFHSLYEEVVSELHPIPLALPGR